MAEQKNNQQAAPALNETSNLHEEILEILYTYLNNFKAN